MPSRSSQPDDPQSESSAPDESRRKLIQRGLAIAPLIVTLAARPVRAQAMGSLGAYEYGTGGEEEIPDPDIEDVPPPDPYGGGKGKGKKR